MSELAWRRTMTSERHDDPRFAAATYWAKWIGKWHRGIPDNPRRAICGYSLGLVTAERYAPPIVERCRVCQKNTRSAPRD